MTESEYQKKFKDDFCEYDDCSQTLAKMALEWTRKNPPPEVMALIEALKFYGQQEQEQWASNSSGPCQIGHSSEVIYSELEWQRKIIVDRGNKAKNALAEFERKMGVK